MESITYEPDFFIIGAALPNEDGVIVIGSDRLDHARLRVEVSDDRTPIVDLVWRPADSGLDWIHRRYHLDVTTKWLRAADDGALIVIAQGRTYGEALQSLLQAWTPKAPARRELLG